MSVAESAPAVVVAPVKPSWLRANWGLLLAIAALVANVTDSTVAMKTNASTAMPPASTAAPAARMRSTNPR